MAKTKAEAVDIPQTLLSEGVLLAFKKDEVILKENEVAREMYVIRSGNVLIYRNYLGQKIDLARLGPGEIFGEFSFFDGAPRSATVVALTDVELLRITTRGGKDIYDELPDWMKPVLRCVFSRFRELDEKLTTLIAVNEVRHKHFGVKDVLERIYKELSRLFKLLLIVDHENPKGLSQTAFLRAFDTLVGTSQLNLNVFWSHFARLSLIDEKSSATHFRIKRELLEKVSETIDVQIKSQLYYCLGSKSWGILKQILSSRCEGSVPLETFIKEFSTLRSQDTEELFANHILKKSSVMVQWDQAQVLAVYTLQTIVSAFKLSYR